jgi:hypothetical protein
MKLNPGAATSGLRESAKLKRFVPAALLAYIAATSTVWTWPIARFGQRRLNDRNTVSSRS